MTCTFKQVLEKLTHEKAAGPSPTFTTFHLLATLELIASKPVGRNRLAEALQVGDGVIRTIISRLKDAELIDTAKAGCSLTDKGTKLWKEYSSVIRKTEIGKNELAFAAHNYAVLVENRGHEVKSGMEQRDAAIMMGTKSVTTMVFKNKHLIIPSVSNDVAKDFPEVAKQIIRLLNPQENDAIIIGSADDGKKAEYGAVAAAWTLLKDD